MKAWFAFYLLHEQKRPFADVPQNRRFKNLAMFTENTCVGISNTGDSKETSTQVFSCEYCKIFKKSFFYRTLLVAASAWSYSSVKAWNSFKPFYFEKYPVWVFLVVTDIINCELKLSFFLALSSLKYLLKESLKL